MCNPQQSSWCDDDRCLKQGAFRDVHRGGKYVTADDPDDDDVLGWSIAILLKEMALSGSSPAEPRRRWRCLLDHPRSDASDDDNDDSEEDAEEEEEEDALARFADFDDDAPSSSSDVETNDRGERYVEKPFVRHV